MSKSPQIQFPCADYPIKIIGHYHAHFYRDMLLLLRSLGTQVNEERSQVRTSAQGQYISVTLFIEAQGVSQLQQINQSLRRDQRVKLVL